jgi:hypothetical protein
MDDNTRIVLTSVIALISAVVTPIVVVYVNNRTNKRVSDVSDKVDVYHKEVNGNMAKLIQTTKDLATATEKAKHIKH